MKLLPLILLHSFSSGCVEPRYFQSNSFETDLSGDSGVYHDEGVVEWQGEQNDSVSWPEHSVSTDSFETQLFSCGPGQRENGFLIGKPEGGRDYRDLFERGSVAETVDAFSELDSLVELDSLEGIIRIGRVERESPGGNYHSLVLQYEQQTHVMFELGMGTAFGIPYFAAIERDGEVTLSAVLEYFARSGSGGGGGVSYDGTPYEGTGHVAEKLLVLQVRPFLALHPTSGYEGDQWTTCDEDVSHYRLVIRDGYVIEHFDEEKRQEIEDFLFFGEAGASMPEGGHGVDYRERYGDNFAFGNFSLVGPLGNVTYKAPLRNESDFEGQATFSFPDSLQSLDPDSYGFDFGYGAEDRFKDFMSVTGQRINIGLYRGE